MRGERPTAGNHVFVLHACLMSSLGGRIVIHPHFAVITPEHGVGFPELQSKTMHSVPET